MTRLLHVFVALAALGSTSCAMCGACADAIEIRVAISGDGPVSVSDSRLSCTEAGDVWVCTARERPEGDYSISISAPEHQTQTHAFSIGPPSGGGLYCSDCPDGYFARVTLAPL